MLTSWTDTVPTRPSKMLCTAADHLLHGAVGYLTLEPLSACPECDGALLSLAAPVVAQCAGEAVANYINRASYCPACPVVVIDRPRLRATLGSRADSAHLVGIMVGGASDKGSDSTVYPFDDVRILAAG